MNCVARHDIKDVELGTVSEAYPHLIMEARAAHAIRVPDAAMLTQQRASLQGFTSALGVRVSNILKFLFPVPKEDRRVAQQTHNAFVCAAIRR